MLRKSLDSVAVFAAYLRRRQRIVPKASPAKVNLGCGLMVADGWLNIDSSLNVFFAGWPRPLLRMLYRVSGARGAMSPDDYVRVLREYDFVHHNLKYGLPLPDASVDYLYTSHMLDQLFVEDADRLIREIGRVVKPNGLLRVCLCDLERVVRLYQDGNKLKALSYLFPASDAPVFARHRYLFDFDMMKDRLEAIGFHGVRRCAFREGDMPQCDELDTHPDSSFFLEARR